MSDLDRALQLSGVQAIGEGQRRRAAIAVASLATDERDCLELLRMLGLVDPPRRARRGRAGVPSPDAGNPDLWPALY